MSVAVGRSTPRRGAKQTTEPLQAICPYGHVLTNVNLIGWGEPFVCPTCRGPLRLLEPAEAAHAPGDAAPRAPKRPRRRGKAKGPIAMICPYGHVMEHYGLWGCRRCLMEAITGLSPRVKPKGYQDMRERGVPLRNGPSATGWSDPVYPAYKSKTAVRLEKVAPRWIRETIYDWLSNKTRETARVYRRVITDFIRTCTWLFSEITFGEVVAWAEERGGKALARRDLTIVSSFISHLQRQGYRVENLALRAKRVFRS